MDTSMPKITLETALDLRQLTTTGSILHINESYDECDNNLEPKKESEVIDFIGRPIDSFQKLEKKLVALDVNGLVKKQILEEGGGVPVHDGCTVSIAFTGYWENVIEPFDTASLLKPLVFDLKDSGLLPGLEIAVRSMLVGETSVFLLSYKVMYGEMGIPPRIKAKSDCVFYIKVLKSIITPKEGQINFAEPNMFHRVQDEVKLLYSSGFALYKAQNYNIAAQLFNKAVSMLHKCRLADEKEEKIQETLLKKLYLNLAICYNKIKKPLRACTACNELNRLNNLWNNSKALLQNAKAYRMIGEYVSAEKRLNRAMKLLPNCAEMEAELALLKKARDTCNQIRLISNKTEGTKDEVTEEFKKELDKLIDQFKENVNICKLTLPARLNSDELAYIKEKCIKDDLFMNCIANNNDSEDDNIPETGNKHFVLEKEEDDIEDYEAI